MYFITQLLIIFNPFFSYSNVWTKGFFIIKKGDDKEGPYKKWSAI